jgi:hypothetical protein
MSEEKKELVTTSEQQIVDFISSMTPERSLDDCDLKTQPDLIGRQKSDLSAGQSPDPTGRTCSDLSAGQSPNTIANDFVLTSGGVNADSKSKESVTFTLQVSLGMELDREKFRVAFPNSLIDLSLNDKTAQTLIYNNPFITQEVLQAIYMIMRRKAPIPVSRDLTEAGRYLMIPVLEIVLHPKYSLFHSRYQCGTGGDEIEQKASIKTTQVFLFVLYTQVLMNYLTIFCQKLTP